MDANPYTSIGTMNRSHMLRRFSITLLIVYASFPPANRLTPSTYPHRRCIKCRGVHSSLAVFMPADLIFSFMNKILFQYDSK